MTRRFTTTGANHWTPRQKPTVFFDQATGRHIARLNLQLKGRSDEQIIADIENLFRELQS